MKRRINRGRINCVQTCSVINLLNLFFIHIQSCRLDTPSCGGRFLASLPIIIFVVYFILLFTLQYLFIFIFSCYRNHTLIRPKVVNFYLF